MRLITNHILRSLIASTTSIALVLVAGVWLTQSLRYVDVIVNRGVSLGGYFSLVGFLLPELLALILPVCVLISVLFTYHRLRSDSELLVFQANGMSFWQLARPALLWSFFVTVLVLFLNVSVVPASFRSLRNLDHQIKNEFSTALIQEGVFNSFRGTTVYVKSRLLHGDLQGVFIHQKGQPKKDGTESLPFTIIADKGSLETTAGGLRLILENGQRQEFDPRTQKSSFFRFSGLNFDLYHLSAIKQPRVIKPSERTLEELFYPDEKTLKTLSKPQLMAEAHQRLLFPLLAIMYAVVALSFSLLPRSIRHRRVKRMVFAAATGALIHAVLIIMINFNGIWSGLIPMAYSLLFIVILTAFLALEKSWLFLILRGRQ